MNKRMWELKKQSLIESAKEFDERSPAADLHQHEAFGDEWRSLWLLKTVTLVQLPDGSVRTTGPLLIGLRYHISYMTQSPHPMEIVTVFRPKRLFHPNCNPAGGVCLGHPAPGVSLETILHQAWAGLTFNMGRINTSNGEILNIEAAEFVRANAERFPLTQKGIFEEPDPELAAVLLPVPSILP